jgi:hypothetical protein
MSEHLAALSARVASIDARLRGLAPAGPSVLATPDTARHAAPGTFAAVLEQHGFSDSHVQPYLPAVPRSVPLWPSPLATPGLDVDGEPRLPPVAPATLAPPRIDSQLDNGTPTASKDCAVMTIIGAVRWATGGRVVPTVAEVRNIAGNPRDRAGEPRGLYLSEMLRVYRHYGIDATPVESLDAVRNALGDGAMVHTFIPYDALNRIAPELSGQRDLDRQHAGALYGLRPGADGALETTVLDPLYDGRRGNIPDGPQTPDFERYGRILEKLDGGLSAIVIRPEAAVSPATGTGPATDIASAGASTDERLAAFASFAAERGLPHAELIAQDALRHNVDPFLISAVIRGESSFRAGAENKTTGAAGLMQLMPGIYRRLGIDPFDPAANIDAGTRIISRHLRNFGRVDLALAAYHSGAAAVRRDPDLSDLPRGDAYQQRAIERWARYLNGVVQP